MRVGIYGGSFNPIHAGHVAPVREALRVFDLDQVIYLPTANPPHKVDLELAPAWMRYTMVELALLADPALVVSPFEMNLDGPAYTVETLAHFREECPEDDLFLLIGSDSLASLTRWRDWRRIVELVELIVLTRPGHEPEAIRPGLVPELQTLCDEGRIHLLANRPLDLSSTEIRRRITIGGRPETGWLSPMVLDYVLKYELYRDASSKIDDLNQ